MVALVNNYDIPWAGVHNLFEIVSMHRTMETRHDAWITQPGIGLACLPEPEVQAEPVKLLAHIVYETGGRKIEDTKTGIGGEQFLNE
jgi:hypothetical protein